MANAELQTAIVKQLHERLALLAAQLRDTAQHHAPVIAKTLTLWCKTSGMGKDGGNVPTRSPIEELFAGRHFGSEIVVLCVRWYLSFN